MSEINEKSFLRPKHYAPIAGVESIRIMERFNFNLGNAIKYIWRAGKKSRDTYVEDLEKARQYLDLEIERVLRGG